MEPERISTPVTAAKVLEIEFSNHTCNKWILVKRYKIHLKKYDRYKSNREDYLQKEEPKSTENPFEILIGIIDSCIF